MITADPGELLISADVSNQRGTPLTYNKVLAVKPGFEVSNPADLLAFARSQLAPVLEYDREQNGILLEALGGYFEWGPSITTVADQLDLHPNTVRYRLRKAESLLGISLRNQSDLLDLHLAYRVIQLTQPADVLSAS